MTIATAGFHVISWGRLLHAAWTIPARAPAEVVWELVRVRLSNMAALEAIPPEST